MLKRIRTTPLPAVVGLLPVRALAQILQHGYTPVAHAPLSDLLVLMTWAAGGGSRRLAIPVALAYRYDR